MLTAAQLRLGAVPVFEQIKQLGQQIIVEETKAATADVTESSKEIVQHVRT